MLPGSYYHNSTTTIVLPQLHLHNCTYKRKNLVLVYKLYSRHGE